MRDLSSLLLVISAAGSVAAAQTNVPPGGRMEGAVMLGNRDSAGIRIAENSRQAWSATSSLRLTPSPDLTIGDRPGLFYEFSGVVGAARLSDGRIVVADGSTRQLRFYDSTGTFIRSVGRQGDGPGEMREIFSMKVFPGDTIGLVGPSRVAFFAGDGAFLRSAETRVTGPRAAGTRGMAISQTIGLTPQERLVATFAFPAPRARGARWIEPTHISIVDSSSTVVADLGPLPAMEFAMEEQPRPVWLGAVLAFANDDQTFYVGLGSEYSIRAYGRDGKLRSIIRRSWTPHRVTSDEIDMYVREWGTRWIKSTGAKAEAERKDLRDDPYAERLPAFSQLIVDRGQRLWAREPNVIDAAWAGQLTSPPLAPSRWSVFDDRGRWLGVVTRPARFMPTDIGWDYVIGVAHDDDGVQTIVRYRLRAGSPTRD
jgi:hypothetical protein